MPVGSKFDEWIVRWLQGGATTDQEEMLKRWRAQSPANERRFREVSQLWSVTGLIEPLERGDVPDSALLVETAQSELEDQPQSLRPSSASRSGEPPRRRTASSGSPWRRRAAVSVLAAGFVGLGFGLSGLAKPNKESRPLAESEIDTGAGEMTTVSLRDGTSIRLGPKSKLKLSESDGERSAWLKGRAFFGVAHDSGRPFTVHTEYGEARVLGTRFEVRAEDQRDEFRVLVVQGAVSMRVGGSEVKVLKGEMSRSVRGQIPKTEKVKDVFAQLDWLGNALVFEDTPVKEAVSEIERRYGLRIEIDDRSLAGMTVTAAFTGQSAEKVLTVLCEILDTRCELGSDLVRMGV